MIFIDTSALYAILDRDDDNHESARNVWVGLVDSGTTLWTTNYVMLESCALVQHRLGMEALRALHEDVAPLLKVEWIDANVHALAMSALLSARRRKLSLVDCVSFAVMRQNGSKVAFAYDQHFTSEGFRFPK